MHFLFHIWRQARNATSGAFQDYSVELDPNTKLLEWLRSLGICIEAGDSIAPAFYLNGLPLLPEDDKPLETLALSEMAEELETDEFWLEPFRAQTLPVLEDLAVDRSVFSKLGASMSSACSFCGACVAVCPNASPMLFLAANGLTNLSAIKHVLKDFGPCDLSRACVQACPCNVSEQTLADFLRKL